MREQASERRKRTNFIGQQVLKSQLTEQEKLNICSDFKRWIGTSSSPLLSNSTLLPEQAGELLIEQIWRRLPPQIIIKRLVLTAFSENTAK